jgi:hypothetical protein
MRSTRIIWAGVLLLLVGAVAPGYSQQSQDPKPPKHEPEDRSRGQAAPANPGGLQSREHQPAEHRIDQDEQREVWRQNRAHTWRTEHRYWQQRGGYRGFRIPENRFRPYFGKDHWFRIYDSPMTMVDRHPRFQHGGYWFRLVDPWPEDWSNNWYEKDDVYIDYTDDGYYLYNRNHPGVRVAVMAYDGP